MNLTIYSLKGIQFDGDIISLNVKTAAGEITVLDNHLPLITLLTRGRVAIRTKSGKEEIIAIASGFLEVEKNSKASILAG